MDLFNKKKLAKAHKANNLLIAEIWKMKQLTSTLKRENEQLTKDAKEVWNTNIKTARENYELKTQNELLKRMVPEPKSKKVIEEARKLRNQFKLGPKKKKK